MYATNKWMDTCIWEHLSMYACVSQMKSERRERETENWSTHNFDQNNLPVLFSLEWNTSESTCLTKFRSRVFFFSQWNSIKNDANSFCTCFVWNNDRFFCVFFAPYKKWVFELLTNRKIHKGKFIRIFTKKSFK